MSHKQPSHDHFYEMPIEKLGLSDVAIKALKKRALMSVGDCIDFHSRGTDAFIVGIAPFFSIMYGEVEEKMKAHGYWSFVEDDTE